ncbi:MAG: transcriptional regulator [Albidovulum sp.]|uniref:helix-turn-helix transcriptional regulator n=1 Tax=Albidovulum sp. TaxID=1872424 RepID=UPI003CB8806B
MIEQEKHITAAVVREICGAVSDMTIWRWQNDPTLNFPKPIYIGRRRYWREADVIAWLNAQAEAA